MSAMPSRPDPAPAAELFNVQPCLHDPVTGLLKDRWKLHPVLGALSFLVLFLGGLFAASWLSGTAYPRPGLDCAYLQDRTRLILYAVVVPLGVYLALHFYAQVEVTFERLYCEGIVTAPLEEHNRFLRRLHGRYNAAATHLLPLLLAVVLCTFKTREELADPVRAWLDLDQGPGGYVHLALTLLVWYTVVVVLVKAAITARAMQDMFQGRVCVQPLHPDGCGGLRRLTDLSITIALFVALLALAVVLLVGAGAPFCSVPVLMAVALLVLTPLVFLACLLSAHRVMKEARETLLVQLNRQAQRRYLALCERIGEGEVDPQEAEAILRLEALHNFASRLPVWPTNTQIVAQLTLSVAVPLVLLVLQMVLERSAKG